MNFNSYIPQPYQQQYAYPTAYQQKQPLSNTPSLIWVQGESAAKAYPVAPGNSILLMDSEDQRFFIKSADASGMPLPLRCFSYTEEVSTQQSFTAPEVDTSQFITRQEFEERMNEQMNRTKKEKNNA